MTAKKELFPAVLAVVFLAGFAIALPVRADPLVASGCSVSNVGYLTDLAKDYERLTETLEGMHYIAFSLLMLHGAAPHFCWSS